MHAHLPVQPPSSQQQLAKTILSPPPPHSPSSLLSPLQTNSDKAPSRASVAWARKQNAGFPREKKGAHVPPPSLSKPPKPLRFLCFSEKTNTECYSFQTESKTKAFAERKSQETAKQAIAAPAPPSKRYVSRRGAHEGKGKNGDCPKQNRMRGLF